MTFVHGIICRLFKVFSFHIRKSGFNHVYHKYALAFIIDSLTAFLVQYPTS